MKKKKCSAESVMNGLQAICEKKPVNAFEYEKKRGAAAAAQ